MPDIVAIVGERARHPLTARELAIEECAQRIARALGDRLTAEQRIGLERALDELVARVAWHRW
jgi:hypothetical protein